MKCVCWKNAPQGHLHVCRCVAPVQKCLVLGCYQPGVMVYPPDPGFGKFCEPHGILHRETTEAEERCRALLRILEGH